MSAEFKVSTHDRVVSPWLENALRTAGLWMAALMLPFIFLVILGRFILGKLFPEWVRRSDAKRRQERAQVHKWQQVQLATYRVKGYEELCALPARAPLAASKRFQNFRFTLERKPGDAGGVEISVQAAQRVVWPIWATDSVRFEMLETGEIAEEVLLDGTDDEL